MLSPRCRRASCAPTTAEIPPYRVGWADIAFGIATYNAPHEQLLLAAAGETWLPAAAGADLLLVTDVDDSRSDGEIAPRVAGGAVAVTSIAARAAAETMAGSRARRCSSSSRGGAALAFELYFATRR